MELNKPELIAILMPPLMMKWNMLHDDDRAIFPLLECLTAVAQALRKAFLTFAEPVFGRCMKIIENSLTQTAGQCTLPRDNLGGAIQEHACMLT